MPIGLMVVKWDPRSGVDVLSRYPDELLISEQTLLQIYSTHEFSGEAGMISVLAGSLSVASYYTGPEIGIYIILLMSLDEDPDVYEGALADVSRIVLQNLESNAYESLLPSLFQRLSVYPSLKDEQKYALTYLDDVKRNIINRLREDGVISKSELNVWIKDEYQESFTDIDALIIDLIKVEIIKESSVKGLPSEQIFLINDIAISRLPPMELLKNPEARGLPKKFVADYKAECKKFFETYIPSEEDNLSIIEIFGDPQLYETLRLLRIAIVTKNDLEKLKKKGVEDVDKVLKDLWAKKLIKIFRDDNNNEYFALFTDIFVKLMFPKYLLNTIKEGYDSKSKADTVLIEYLLVLKETYRNLKAKKPKTTKATIEE